MAEVQLVSRRFNLTVPCSPARRDQHASDRSCRSIQTSHTTQVMRSTSENDCTCMKVHQKHEVIEDWHEFFCKGGATEDSHVAQLGETIHMQIRSLISCKSQHRHWVVTKAVFLSPWHEISAAVHPTPWHVQRLPDALGLADQRKLAEACDPTTDCT